MYTCLFLLICIGSQVYSGCACLPATMLSDSVIYRSALFLLITASLQWAFKNLLSLPSLSLSLSLSFCRRVRHRSVYVYYHLQLFVLQWSHMRAPLGAKMRSLRLKFPKFLQWPSSWPFYIAKNKGKFPTFRGVQLCATFFNANIEYTVSVQSNSGTDIA